MVLTSSEGGGRVLGFLQEQGGRENHPFTMQQPSCQQAVGDWPPADLMLPFLTSTAG